MLSPHTKTFPVMVSQNSRRVNRSFGIITNPTLTMNNAVSTFWLANLAVLLNRKIDFFIINNNHYFLRLKDE